MELTIGEEAYLRRYILNARRDQVNVVVSGKVESDRYLLSPSDSCTFVPHIKMDSGMAYWLLKTEPSTYSFEDLQRDKKTTWDGVSNNLALKHIRQMQKGDLAFIYHSGDDKAIVGIAEVVSLPYADPKRNDEKLVVVDLKPKEKLKQPVTLAAVKSKREFARFELVRISRLSVMPVSAAHWKMLLALSAERQAMSK